MTGEMEPEPLTRTDLLAFDSRILRAEMHIELVEFNQPQEER